MTAEEILAIYSNFLKEQKERGYHCCESEIRDFCNGKYEIDVKSLFNGDGIQFNLSDCNNFLNILEHLQENGVEFIIENKKWKYENKVIEENPFLPVDRGPIAKLVDGQKKLIFSSIDLVNGLLGEESSFTMKEIEEMRSFRNFVSFDLRLEYEQRWIGFPKIKKIDGRFQRKCKGPSIRKELVTFYTEIYIDGEYPERSIIRVAPKHINLPINQIWHYNEYITQLGDIYIRNKIGFIEIYHEDIFDAMDCKYADFIEDLSEIDLEVDHKYEEELDKLNLSMKVIKKGRSGFEEPLYFRVTKFIDKNTGESAEIYSQNACDAGSFNTIKTGDDYLGYKDEKEYTELEKKCLEFIYEHPVMNMNFFM